MRLPRLKILHELQLILPVLVGVPHFVIKLITTSSPATLLIPTYHQHSHNAIIMIRLSPLGCFAVLVTVAEASPEYRFLSNVK
jgi:hypothetical protein